MNSIWKFVLNPDREGKAVVNWPFGSRPLHVGEQFGQLMLWAIVRPGDSLVRQEFRVYGTGWDVYHDAEGYIGTVQSGGFVWHIFKQ